MSVLQSLVSEVERLSDLLRQNRPFDNERGQQNQQIRILTQALLGLLEHLERQEREGKKSEFVELKNGLASIDLKKDGEVIIKGRNITLSASGRIAARADGDVVLKGSKVQTN
jgi:hypothetical protein